LPAWPANLLLQPASLTNVLNIYQRRRLDQ
jgi:hypothetical protein